MIEKTTESDALMSDLTQEEVCSTGRTKIHIKRSIASFILRHIASRRILPIPLPQETRAALDILSINSICILPKDPSC